VGWAGFGGAGPHPPPPHPPPPPPPHFRKAPSVCFWAAQIPYSRVSATIEVKYKIGNERLVKVTGNAAAKLSQLLQRQGRPKGALRVAVIGGGCSGLQYKMDLVDGPANRDILVESNSVRVVVDPKSALFVSGSLLDYSDDLQKGGFKVTNPNAVAHCSCGESFSA
jgi:iron-sulfur cluster assembly accessory protein